MNDKLLKSIEDMVEEYSDLKINKLDKSTLQVLFNEIVILTLTCTPKDEFYLESLVVIDESCILGNSLFYTDSSDIPKDIDFILKKFNRLNSKFNEITTQLDCTRLDGDSMSFQFCLSDDNILIIGLSNRGFSTTIYCKTKIDVDVEFLNLIMYISKSLETSLCIKTDDNIDVNMKEIKFFSN